MSFTTQEMTSHLVGLFGPARIIDRPIWQVLKVRTYLHDQDALAARTQREMMSS